MTPFQEIALSVIGIVITGLASWATTTLIAWLKTKIKNEKVAALAEDIVVIATNATKATYQSFVQAIKGTDAWTEEAQFQALDKSLETAKTFLSQDAVKYIQEKHGDVDTYLKSSIEAILYDLKNKPKEENKVA